MWFKGVMRWLGALVLVVGLGDCAGVCEGAEAVGIDVSVGSG